MGDAALARRVHEAAHLTGRFTLRSGGVSEEYFDKYRFESDPALLREVAAGIAELLPAEARALAGPELGAIPLVTMVSQLTGLPARFVRKRAKEYGTCELAEGGPVDGLALAVIEDVVSTAGQLVETCGALRERGAEIAGVVCAIDRESGGAAALAAHGLELRALFTLRELAAAAG